VEELDGPSGDGTVVILDPGDRRGIESYLVHRGLIDDGDSVREVARAGPGNMNLVLRVVTDSTSLVVKQGRPYVEKYPHIPAPPERTVLEAEWYLLAASRPDVARRLPALVGVDRESSILVLADLGRVGDLTELYAGERLGEECIDTLARWLAALHGGFRGDEAARELANAGMRRLNHEHIFEVPLREGNGLDLDTVTPGLASVVQGLRSDRRLRDATASLGAAYLGEGATLLHGDFHPGSWLAGAAGPYVIDPEFAFFGLPEFDVGVALAHLELSGQPQAASGRLLAVYRARAPLDADLAWAFSGAEVIRRLLGVAQLPLPVGLGEKQELIGRAVDRVKAAG
jgi:5-methylthioribose kinase